MATPVNTAFFPRCNFLKRDFKKSVKNLNEPELCLASQLAPPSGKPDPASDPESHLAIMLQAPYCSAIYLKPGLDNSLQSGVLQQPSTHHLASGTKAPIRKQQRCPCRTGRKKRKQKPHQTYVVGRAARNRAILPGDHGRIRRQSRLGSIGLNGKKKRRLVRLKPRAGATRRGHRLGNRLRGSRGNHHFRSGPLRCQSHPERASPRQPAPGLPWQPPLPAWS